jgi:hypothetical protein
MLFVGMFFCLFLKPFVKEKSDKTKPKLPKFLLFYPAMCDTLATILDATGLIYVRIIFPFFI